MFEDESAVEATPGDDRFEEPQEESQSGSQEESQDEVANLAAELGEDPNFARQFSTPDQLRHAIAYRDSQILQQYRQPRQQQSPQYSQQSYRPQPQPQSQPQQQQPQQLNWNVKPEAFGDYGEDLQGFVRQVNDLKGYYDNQLNAINQYNALVWQAMQQMWSQSQQTGQQTMHSHFETALDGVNNDLFGRRTDDNGKPVNLSLAQMQARDQLYPVFQALQNHYGSLSPGALVRRAMQAEFGQQLAEQARRAQDAKLKNQSRNVMGTPRRPSARGGKAEDKIPSALRRKWEELQS